MDSLLYLNLDTAYVVGSLYIADTVGLYKREMFYTGDKFNYSTATPRMYAETRRIAFHAQMEGEPPSLWFLEPDSGNLRRMKSIAERPDFSPDGNHIIFTDTREDNGRLWIINWDGSELRQLTY